MDSFYIMDDYKKNVRTVFRVATCKKDLVKLIRFRYNEFEGCKMGFISETSNTSYLIGHVKNNVFTYYPASQVAYGQINVKYIRAYYKCLIERREIPKHIKIAELGHSGVLPPHPFIKLITSF